MQKKLKRPNFLVTYVDQPFIDFFCERGNLLHRLDLHSVFSHSCEIDGNEVVELIKVDFVRTP